MFFMSYTGYSIQSVHANISKTHRIKQKIKKASLIGLFEDNFLYDDIIFLLGFEGWKMTFF